MICEQTINRELWLHCFIHCEWWLSVRESCELWSQHYSWHVIQFIIREIPWCGWNLYSQNRSECTNFNDIFTNFPGSMPPPLRLAHLQGLIHHRSPPLQKAMLRSATCLISCKLICQPCGVDKMGRSRVNELLNEWKNQGDEGWFTVGPMSGTPLVIRQIKKSNLFVSINDLNTIF